MSDLDRYLTDEMIEKGREALTFGIMGCGQCCGENPPDELDHLDHDVARAHVAARAALSAVLPDIIQRAKAEALRDAADELSRLDDGRTGGYYDAGRHIIRRLDARADQIEQGGQP